MRFSITRVLTTPIGQGLGLVLVLALMALRLAGQIMSWPGMDEGNYILEAARIANGQLPYRDFYDFITPGGQFFGALLIKINGFSVLGLRLWLVMAWFLILLLIYDMLRERVSKVWCFLFLAFLWLTESMYPVYQHHFWSGLTALIAVYCIWRALKQIYQGKSTTTFLAISGIFTALTFWITQSLGVLMALALGVFSVLHCILQEKEEKGVSFRQLSWGCVVRRWLKPWGGVWLGTMLGVHLVWVVAFLSLGIWDEFWRDSIQWLTRGHYQQTTVIGYYSTFSQEVTQTLRPFIDQLPAEILVWFTFRIFVVAHLFLIGVLPIIGILGTWYVLPGRFLYRLLRREDEVLLLFLLASLALVVSTFNYSGSMHIVSNGPLPLMLGWLVLVNWLSARPKHEREMQVVTAVFCVLLLFGGIIGSLMQLLGGTWLPRFTGMMESLLYVEGSTNPQQFLSVVNLLEEAKAKGRTVFVFSETPSLYLPGLYPNATRFTLVLPFYNSPEQMAEIFSDLEKNKPFYIVDDQTRFRLPDDVRFKRYTPEQLRMQDMEAYLKTHYRLYAVAGRFLVYRRNQYFD